MRFHRSRPALQRQLFRWLVGTMFVTAATVAVVVGLIHPWDRVGGARQREVRWNRVESVVVGAFADRWDEPSRRRALAEDLSEALGATFQTTDAQRRTLERAGPACDDYDHVLSIQRGAQPIGYVEFCFSPRKFTRPLLFLPFLAVAVVLWAAAAILARRLTRPLSSLIAVTREIGAGNLQARVRLGRYQRGELGWLADSVNDMADRIERQMRDQRELLAVVSHEVRSPLARLRVSAELLRGQPNHAAALEAVEREVQEIDVLVGKLLASSRLDFGSLAQTPVDPAQVARTSIERRALDLAMLQDFSEAARVTGDPTLIARALDNLLDNAERHAGGAVGMNIRKASAAELSRGERGIVFEVVDAGPGFEPQALRRAFDSFYQGGRRSDGQHASLGLGLSLVRRIAEAHGGRAWADNLPGGGARVSFSVG